MPLSFIRPAPCALAILALAAGAACAETSPYYIGISQALNHDSNVFRVSNTPTLANPSGQVQSDTYSSTAVQGGIDQPFGRQRFYGNGTVTYNRYNHEKELNNTSYALNTGLDLSTVQNISGAVNYSLNQSLLNYGNANVTQFRGKNLERTQQLLGRASWGGQALVSIDLTGTHRTLRYSVPNYAAQPFDQNSASLGVNYRPSSLLTLGVALRATRGTYQGVPDFDIATQTFLSTRTPDTDFSRDDIDLTAQWMPSGLSTVNGRLSFGRQKNDANVSRASSNVNSGSLSWDYKPTGKLTFNLWLSRDTGTESSFFDRVNIVTQETRTSVGDNSQLTNTFSLRTSYAATGKIGVNANLRYARRTLRQASSFNGQSSEIDGKDRDTSLSLGVVYQPIRSVQLGCNLGRDQRSVKDAGTNTPLLSYPYKATTYGCYGQFTLR